MMMRVYNITQLHLKDSDRAAFLGQFEPQSSQLVERIAACPYFDVPHLIAQHIRFIHDLLEDQYEEYVDHDDRQHEYVEIPPPNFTLTHRGEFEHPALQLSFDIMLNVMGKYDSDWAFRLCNEETVKNGVYKYWDHEIAPDLIATIDWFEAQPLEGEPFGTAAFVFTQGDVRDYPNQPIGMPIPIILDEDD